MSNGTGRVCVRAVSLLGLGLFAGVGCRAATPLRGSVAGDEQRLSIAEYRALDEAGRDAYRVRYFREHYTKHEYRIPMRDGVTLFTAVYSPNDMSHPWPLLMRRTPYSVAPYGEDDFPRDARHGVPVETMLEEGFIFVYQDVRGCFMSEGEFVNMRPHLDVKHGPRDIDESTDTYDTIEWLVNHVPNNNGRVGLWGISYPGFYAAAGMIDAHPALKAVTPEAPISDWYFDDFHHHGAFCLADAFNFFWSFGRARDGLTTTWAPGFDHGTPDGYDFFLRMGPVRNANERYMHGEIAFWNAAAAHPNYDEFWQSRNILPHLHNVAPAVMVVGGLYDAEDLYGPLNIYRSVERRNPNVFNVLVMGPWIHGGWERTDGDELGDISFGAKTSWIFRDEMQLPFFRHFLKDEGECDQPEAYIFDTGRNEWRRFDAWPPHELRSAAYYCAADGGLATSAPTATSGVDEFISDPNKPVPYSPRISTHIERTYMIEDQRFAARRPDVLAYETEPLSTDVTLAGVLTADLWVSTSQSAADWVVKVIDVYPGDAGRDPLTGAQLGGYQRMVRSEVIRGRYRNSIERPEPFTPNKPAHVVLPLQDVLHTFRAGHRIMIQIQSTWFPLIDRNPQKYVDNIFEAQESDFVSATHRVYRSAEHASCLRVGVLGGGG